MKTKPITLILTLLFCLSGSVFAEEKTTYVSVEVADGANEKDIALKCESFIKRELREFKEVKIVPFDDDRSNYRITVLVYSDKWIKSLSLPNKAIYLIVVFDKKLPKSELLNISKNKSSEELYNTVKSLDQYTFVMPTTSDKIKETSESVASSFDHYILEKIRAKSE